MTTILRWYLWLGVYVGFSRAEQKFAIEPQDQMAIIGSKVTLPCRVINKSGYLQWTRDDFALGNHRNLSDYVRYSMVGTDDEGDYNLAIEHVQLEDNARFQCQVGPGNSGKDPGIRSRFAYLTVLVPPNPPEIVQGEQMTTTEDREIELECVSRGGKPAAEIIWIDGLNNVVTKLADYRSEPQPNKLETARSILKIVPKKEHHNTTFVCQAFNNAERQYQSAKLRLYVKYAPKVTLKVSGTQSLGNIWWNQLVEGADVRITCQADANPADVNYRWYVNDTSTFPDSPTELLIRNISRTHHESIVKCEAYNSVGKSEDSETLQIIYGPRFVRKPESVQAETNTVVTLTCEVDGNPPPEISWIHEKFEKKLVGRTSNLTLRVTNETIGKYYCKAFTSGFPEISSEAYVHIKGRPVIVRQPIQFGLPGDSIRLDCNVYSIPLPERVSWSFNGRDVGSESQQDYKVIEETTSDGVRSSLVVRDSKPDQFGVYNCTVFNKYGSDSIPIMLKPQKSFPLTLVLFGILGGVVVVVTVILITLLCQRKVKKMPPPPPAIVIDSEKQCKDSDRSSNISDIKLEIRTGSSASNQNCEDYNMGHDSDSVITRLGPLSTSLALDSRYSINRFSSSDFPDPEFPPKPDGHNNNGYVPYVDYAKDYNPPLSSVRSSQTASPSITASNFHTNALDFRFNGTYGNLFSRTGCDTPTTLTSTLPNGQPPPPPYCTLRNGNLPHLGRFPHSPSSRYIVAGNSQTAIIKKGSLATHV